MGDGFMGGVQASAVDAIREAAAEGAKAAARDRRGRALRQEDASARWPRRSGRRWRLQSRLSDVVVFDDARGQGQAARWPRCSSRSSPTSSARRWWRAPGFSVGGVVAVAWDGGKEASRAVRTACRCCEKASKVVILSAPAAAARQFDPAGLQAYLTRARRRRRRSRRWKVRPTPRRGCLKAAIDSGANLLVAGAFGHPRLQEFVFGGATRTFFDRAPRPPCSFRTRIDQAMANGARTTKVRLSRIVMRLARNPGTEFADGDDHRGYSLVAPLTAGRPPGRRGLRPGPRRPARCAASRRTRTPATAGSCHQGRTWFFDYDNAEDTGEEPVFRLGQHRFAVGEYVSITDEDGRLLTYKVTDVTPA